MSNSSGGISVIPLIVFLFFAYNLLFDDDKEEVKDTSNETQVEIKVESKDVGEKLNNLADKLTEKSKVLSDKIKDFSDSLKSEPEEKQPEEPVAETKPTEIEKEKEPEQDEIQKEPEEKPKKPKLKKI